MERETTRSPGRMEVDVGPPTPSNAEMDPHDALNAVLHDVNDYNKLCATLERIHEAVETHYAAASRTPERRARAVGDAFQCAAQRLERCWMRNRDALRETRESSSLYARDVMELDQLLHVLKCLCLVNTYACDGARIAIDERLSAAGMSSVASRGLAMCGKPITRYAVSELREATWQVAARWREARVDHELELLLELLELRYGMLLRCAFREDVHDVREFRHDADDPRGPGWYVISETMISEMTAFFGDVAEALWTKSAFPALAAPYGARAQCEAPTALQAAAVVRLLRQHCADAKSNETLQRAYRLRYMEAALRLGERDAFAPSNLLFQPNAQNVLRARRGSNQHGVLQHRALEPVLDVLSRLRDGGEAACSERLTWEQDAAVICAADGYFKSRYKLRWAGRFLVHAREYRTKRALFAQVTPPLVFDACNGFDVYYGGYVLETACLPASIALWIFITARYFDRKFCKSLSDLSDEIRGC